MAQMCTGSPRLWEAEGMVRTTKSQAEQGSKLFPGCVDLCQAGGEALAVSRALQGYTEPVPAFGR